MLKPTFLALGFWVVFLCAGTVQARPTPPAFFGIYLKGTKIGSLTVQRDPSTVYNGRPAVRTQTCMNLDVMVGKVTTHLVSTNIGWTVPRSGLPLASDTRTRSGGTETRVQAMFTPRSVRYVAHVTGSVQKATLTLKPGESFLADPAGTGLPLAVGKTFAGKQFQADPAVLTLSDSRLKVVGKTTLLLDGKPAIAYKVEDYTPSAPATQYLSTRGELLRTENTFGVRIERQSKAVALATAKKSVDVSRIASIVPSGDTRWLREAPVARYEIRGLTRPLPPSDAVQQISPLIGSGRGTLVTVTANFPVEGAVRFTQSADAPAHLQPFLRPTLYVSSDAPEFQTLALMLVGNETDPVRAAAKISEYVHQKLTADPSISNLRSALDIHRTPRGVCRDYTLYFTAIARAAGIPTKQCVGVVLTNGVFAGHAWPEVWTGTTVDGQDRWIGLEPTWGETFADATHIKLSEGELTDFFAIASDFERLSIRVLPEVVTTTEP